MLKYIVIAAAILGYSAYAQPNASPVDMATPDLKKWVQPTYPNELKKGKITGRVLVHFTVNENGKVSDARVHESTDPRFEAAALAAVEEWEFFPAIDSGKNIACSMQAPVVFTLPEPAKMLVPPPAQIPKPRPKVPAKEIATPSPQYPEDFLDRLIEGRVDFEFTIGRQGQVKFTKLLSCTHPRFLPPMLAAIENWKFEPARQGDLPFEQTRRAAHGFTVTLADPSHAAPAHKLAANGFQLRVEPGRDAASYCNALPEILHAIEPVYPYALALANEEGEAELSFVVSATGSVESIQIVRATHPDCGLSAKAALAWCRFEPGWHGGEKTAVPMTYLCKFSPTPPVVLPNEHPQHRLLRQLRSGEKFATAKGLDTPLKPVLTVKPHGPSANHDASTEVQVRVDCIVYRDGMIQLPQYKDAPTPEAGWAAVTALSQWVFERPKKHGQSVDVRVAIPIPVRL
jgi:TonB family protein